MPRLPFCLPAEGDAANPGPLKDLALGQVGINSDAILGNKTQVQRSIVLLAFREGRVRVPVATNVAALGLDINNLPHVVNFDLPPAGTTGRGTETYIPKTSLSRFVTLAVGSVRICFSCSASTLKRPSSDLSRT